MPFGIKGGKYNVQMLDNSVTPKVVADGTWLASKWKGRLNNFLKYADQNGVAVMIDLFDENEMKNGQKPLWDNNPWNPSHNNLNDAPASCAALDNSNTMGDGLPSMYQICSNPSTCSDPVKDSQLNCLGKVEKNYVLSIVNHIANQTGAKLCGANHNLRCRNVIFEVMNEARYDGAWSNLSTDQFKKWHNTVASWIKRKGQYVIAVNVKGPSSDSDGHPCSSDTSNFDDSCLLAKCTSGGSCPPHHRDKDYPNYFSTFLAAKADVLSLHSATWLQEPLQELATFV